MQRLRKDSSNPGEQLLKNNYDAIQMKMPARYGVKLKAGIRLDRTIRRLVLMLGLIRGCWRLRNLSKSVLLRFKSSGRFFPLSYY